MTDDLRFERRGDGEYYKVVLHVGDAYVPVGDEDVAALKTHGASAGDDLPDVFLNRLGYSSYLKERLERALLTFGDRAQQAAEIRRAIRDL